MFDLEDQINKWKSHLNETASINENDAKGLESHLRDSIDDLLQRGITEEEAFFLSVRRLGEAEILAEEYTKLSTEDQWRQLLVPAKRGYDRKEFLVVLLLALLGGLLFKIPSLFGFGDYDAYDYFYIRNLSLFAFPPVALYFLYKQRLMRNWSMFTLLAFPILALLLSLYPFKEPWHTSLLASIHLPLLLLFVLLYCYGGSSWKKPNTRLNFIRFAGEAFIYAVLIGLGGLVLIFLTLGTFGLVKVDAKPFILRWMGPFGLFGLLPVAAFLVNKKKSPTETLAPVLSQIFTPLFIIVLSGLLAAFCLNPREIFANRSMLIWFDVLLAFTLALTVYSMSATDRAKQASTFPLRDILTWILLLLSILIDLIALIGILSRLSSFGFSANRSAALGENLLLLVNLILLAVGYGKYLFKRSAFQGTIEMQMRYMACYGIWAAVVVTIFPLLFSFL